MVQKIEAIDPSFNFDSAYVKNSLTLLNFLIVPKEKAHFYFIDNEPQLIFFPKPLYLVLFREWQNNTWLELKDGTNAVNNYWSSAEKARNWMKETLVSQKIRTLESKEESLKVAQSYLDTKMYLAKNKIK